MKTIRLSINQYETGKNIRTLMEQQGYTIKDVQVAMGFDKPQAIYKWVAGKSLPCLDNLLILSKVLNTTMENILVVDGDVSFIHGELHPVK